MSSPEFPGLDVSSRVRARDVQLAAVAHLRHRVLMITGAVDTTLLRGTPTVRKGALA